MSGPPWSGQPPQRKPVTLKNWFVQPMKGGVAVEGYKAESDEVKTTLVNWRSTVIVKRISPQLVQTGSGSLYRLYKELDDEAAKENGIPEELISPFLRGFPDDWEQRVKAFYEPTSVRPAVPRQLVNDVQQREKENHPPAKQNLTNKSPAPPPVSRGSSSKELNDMAANLNTPTTAIVRRSTRLSALRTPLSVNGTTKVDIYERIAAAQTPLTTKKNELRLREEKKRLEEEEKRKVEEMKMEEEEERKMAEENERKKAESERRKKENAKNVVAVPSHFKVPTGVAARRRGRSIGQATCMLMESAIRLRRWVLKFMRGGDETSIFPNFRFNINGWRPETADDDYANTWTTSSIVRVIPPSLMITASSVYYLNGPMDVKQAREMGMPVSFCQAFSTGFPENWMQLLGDVYNTMIEPTGPRIVEVVSDTERASQQTRSNQEKPLSSSEAYSSEDEWADMRERERKRKVEERREREEQREREKQRKEEEEEKREREEQRARKSLEKAKEEKRKKEEAGKKKRRSSTSKAVLPVGSTELVPLPRSRSGRLLRPPMAEWAGQSAKYDAHGNLVEITGATTASHLLTPTQIARGNALAVHFGVSPSRISPLQQERRAQATTENAGKTPCQLKKRLSSVSNKSTAKRTPPVIAKKRATTSSTKRRGHGRLVEYSDSESSEESEEKSNWERKKKKTPQAARSPRTPLSLAQQRRKTPSTAEPTPVIGRVGGKRKMTRIDSSDEEEEEERERREKRKKREAAKWERRQIKEEEEESEEENRKKRRTQQRKRQVIAKRGASNRVRINSEMISECPTSIHDVETEGEHEERENSRLTRPLKKAATTRERAKRKTQRKKSKSEEKRKQEEEAKSESTDLDELSARLLLSEGSDEEKEEERARTEERRRVSAGTRKRAGGERAEEDAKKPVKKRAQPWRVEELQRLKIAFNAMDMTRPESWDKIAASLGGKRTVEEIKKAALERLNLCVDEQENEEEEDEDDTASIRSGEISDDNPAAIRKQTVLQRLRAEQAKEALLKGGSRRDEDFFENTVFDGPSMMPSMLAADLNDSMFSLLVTPEFAQPNKPRCTKRAQQAREAEADESPSPFTLFGSGTPLAIAESGRGASRAARKSSFLPSPKKNDEDRIRFAHQLERRMNMSIMNRSRMTSRPERTLDQTQRELDSVLEKSRALGKKRGRVLEELEEDDEDEENEDVEEGGLLSMR